MLEHLLEDSRVEDSKFVNSNAISVRSSGSNPSTQVSTNKNPYILNVVLKYYRCGENSFEVKIEYEELEIEGEVEENFIEFDIGDAMSHSLVVRRLMRASEAMDTARRTSRINSKKIVLAPIQESDFSK
ncbi:unnamed protein product [Spirodela intermedia]|uniref:Uncharacterized protein n=1 Tax=Spirodela intermedia TaxID=51605 RepID=A0A7I8IJG3_SPIIN|nr:unnamed protein product [Spirodela intermedia]CAA6658027.1 unnamed protein product [Spirodela intermedia]